MEFILIIFALVALVIAASIYETKKRREALIAKYGAADIVDMIMKKQIWRGMTENMLLDSWGKPSSIEEKVYKTKTTSTYKYHKTGKNQYKSRVIVEDGCVVGWKQR